MHNTLKLIRPAMVCQMLAISKASLWRLSKNSDFPKSIRIGNGRAVAYDSKELEDYINLRKKERVQ